MTCRFKQPSRTKSRERPRGLQIAFELFRFLFFSSKDVLETLRILFWEIFWRWRFAKDFFLFGFKFERVETKNANATILASFQKKNQCQSVSKSDGTQLRVWLLRQSNRSPLPYYIFQLQDFNRQTFVKEGQKVVWFPRHHRCRSWHELLP